MNTPNKYPTPYLIRFIITHTILVITLVACNFEEIEEDNPSSQEAEAISIENTKPNNNPEIIIESIPEETTDVLANGDIQLSESLFLDKDKKFTTKIFSQSEYNKFLTKDGDVTIITKEIYQHYKDDFDFIIILGVEKEQPKDLDVLVLEPLQMEATLYLIVI